MTSVIIPSYRLLYEFSTQEDIADFQLSCLVPEKYRKNSLGRMLVCNLLVFVVFTRFTSLFPKLSRDLYNSLLLYNVLIIYGIISSHFYNIYILLLSLVYHYQTTDDTKISSYLWIGISLDTSISLV